MNNENLIEVESLSRRYAGRLVVDNISFTIPRGQVLGFLGPNGAGKSTTMQMLAGILFPHAGVVRIAGVDMFKFPVQAKQHIGFLSEKPPLYSDLTVDEYLTHCARLRRVPPAKLFAAVAKSKSDCALSDVGKRLIGNLSKGYQQRVGIAQAIIHTPQVIILDEPTSGLDPIQICKIRTLIKALKHEHSIILSTHILSDVQGLCDHVLIIHRGKLVFDQSMEVTNADVNQEVEVVFNIPPDCQVLENFSGVKSVEQIGMNTFVVEFENGADPTDKILECALREGWGLRRWEPHVDPLQSRFLQLTKDMQTA